MAKDKAKADPPAPPSPWIFRGGFFLLIGFAVLAMCDLAFANLAVDPNLLPDAANARYLAISAVFAAGEVLIGLGFFLALFGFSRRPAAQA